MRCPLLEGFSDPELPDHTSCLLVAPSSSHQPKEDRSPNWPDVEMPGVPPGPSKRDAVKVLAKAVLRADPEPGSE